MNESLEKTQQNRILDQEYEKNNWEWFKKAKKDKLGLYWEFKIPKNKKNTKETQNNSQEKPLEEDQKIKEKFQIPEKVKDLEDFPIIENLYNSWEIQEEQYLELVEILENTDKKDTKKEIVKFLNENLKNSQNFDKIKNYFNPKEKVDENNFDKSEFAKESKLSWVELDIATWELETMLANNFINIWGENKKASENINTSIDITLNKLIDKKSTDFKQNNSEIIWDIKKEKNPNSKYKLLKELYKQYLVDDAKFWWKKAKTEIAKKKKTIENKTKKIKEQLQEQVKNNKITQEQAKKKFEEIQTKLRKEWIDNLNLEKEIQKIEWAIKSWKLDQNSENIEKNKQ